MPYSQRRFSAALAVSSTSGSSRNEPLMTRLDLRGDARANLGSTGERHLETRIKQMRLPIAMQQYRFAAPERQWRADFAWPEHWLIVEVEGGSWIAGRHTRGAGYAADLQRANWAQTHGWTILRYTTEQVESDEAINELVAWFQGRTQSCSKS